jgi:hypothetical protein
MSRIWMTAALTLTTSFCAPTTHATAYRQATPKRSAEAVEVFTDVTPSRPYEEVGSIEVAAAELSNSHYGDLVQRARARAAEMGADAIIVTRDPQSRNVGMAYVPPAKRKVGQFVTGTSRTVETPRIQVAAIAWKSAGTD